jgi:hypothetical protein
MLALATHIIVLLAAVIYMLAASDGTSTFQRDNREIGSRRLIIWVDHMKAVSRDAP